MQVFSAPVWDGARNAADLGGLPLRDGGATQFGRVWRSAAPEWMSTQGWRAARASGLSCVIDLRNSIELGRNREHPVIDERARNAIAIRHVPTENPDDADFLAECGPWLDHPRSWAPNARRYPELFRDVFTAIADADGPLLVHCAGGRDRTGMICSMLMVLNDVDADAITANYEHGFRGAGAHRGHGLSFDPAQGALVPTSDDVWSEAELADAMAERIPALRQWLGEFDVAGYLTESGLDPTRLEHLRALLR